MFARAFLAVVFVLPSLAAASALPQNDAFTTTNITPATGSTLTVDQCNTGTLQCCDETQTVQTSSIATLLGVLGFVTGGATSLVGSNCSPITTIGGAENSCTAQPVCCTGNDFRGLIVLGCNAVNLGSAQKVAAVAGLVGNILDLD